MEFRSVLLWLVFTLAGCGAAEVGEECDEAGETDECEDGAVCTNEGDGAVCRALCKEHEECRSGESCNGVSDTNLKSCQPDE
jgi:hypothetical protein